MRGQPQRGGAVRRALFFRVVADHLRRDLPRRIRGRRGEDGAGDPRAGLADEVQIADDLVLRPVGVLLVAVPFGRQVGDRAVAVGAPRAEPAPVDVVDARNAGGIRGERGLFADQPHARRRADREESGLRVERVVVQAHAVSRRRVDEVHVSLLPLRLVGDRDGDLVLVRVVGVVPRFGAGEVPGGRADLEGVRGDDADLAAAGRHHAELARVRPPVVPPFAAVGAERDPFPVGRNRGVRMVVVAVGELRRLARLRIDPEQMVAGVDDVAERVAAVVGLADHHRPRRIAVACFPMRIHVHHRDDEFARGRPCIGNDVMIEIGQPSRLGRVQQLQPELPRRVLPAGVRSARPQERESPPVRRPLRRGVLGALCEETVARSVDLDQPNRGAGRRFAAMGAAVDVGDPGAVGRERGAAGRGQVVDDVGGDGIGHLALRMLGRVRDGRPARIVPSDRSRRRGGSRLA